MTLDRSLVAMRWNRLRCLHVFSVRGEMVVKDFHEVDYGGR